MGQRDEVTTNLLEVHRRLHSSGICGFAEGVRVFDRGAGIILVERGKARVLFHMNARFEGVLDSLAMRGLLNRCVYGCKDICILES